MKSFIIFFAPFVFLIGALAMAFWVGPNDKAVRAEKKEK